MLLTFFLSGLSDERQKRRFYAFICVFRKLLRNQTTFETTRNAREGNLVCFKDELCYLDCWPSVQKNVSHVQWQHSQKNCRPIFHNIRDLRGFSIKVRLKSIILRHTSSFSSLRKKCCTLFTNLFTYFCLENSVYFQK